MKKTQTDHAGREKKKVERVKQKAERLRWKDVIDNWLPIEGSDLLKLASDKSVLKRMRTEGWETAKFPAGQDFPGLHNEEGGPTKAVLDAESPLELILTWRGTRAKQILRPRAAGKNGLEVSFADRVKCNDPRSYFGERKAYAFKNSCSRNFTVYWAASSTYDVPTYLTTFRSLGHYFDWRNSSGDIWSLYEEGAI
ncbi:hypothetical protein PHMEG_00035807 [Phytophthora megakarya]|uniref:Uncharacterized protein n=1 Tax=Phytophthora megakarya TaxID=4795 RepID=A0A225UMV8_9STRA|nr:hypothetical protein PHMEG_00035807 [Phytophthora megakarya]